MKVCRQLDHKGAILILSQKGNLWQEIENSLYDPELLFGIYRPNEIKAVVATKLSRLGWADRVRVSNKSLLTVNFMKDKVGVCLQLGNISRIYADLLKLSVLGQRSIIDVGIIIVPDKFESRLLGANYASFDRIAREMSEYKELIGVPLLILGLSN